jgi:hypothetical protein
MSALPEFRILMKDVVGSSASDLWDDINQNWRYIMLKVVGFFFVVLLVCGTAWSQVTRRLSVR